ncbi:hypothetical protein BGAFAR04_E0021 (plasmid) [Borreliella garinii Far04]|nr:hypothetical protein BGAFAR04_E0021 [Borreliella garinii Far04]
MQQLERILKKGFDFRKAYYKVKGYYTRFYNSNWMFLLRLYFSSISLKLLK